MERIIKVDHVCSANEATKLQRLGVDIIGVYVNAKSKYTNGRKLNFDSIQRIKDVLESTKLALEITSDQANIVELIERFEPAYIQFSDSEILKDIEQIKEIEASKVKVIFKGNEASYDDDPSWILSSFLDIENSKSYIYQIEILTDMENSWNFFKDECQRYEDELQISDINKLGEQFPLLISLDFTSENIVEISKSFPSILGMSFTLSGNRDSNSAHYLSYESMIEILEHLKLTNSVI